MANFKQRKIENNLSKKQNFKRLFISIDFGAKINPCCPTKYL